MGLAGLFMGPREDFSTTGLGSRQDAKSAVRKAWYTCRAAPWQAAWGGAQPRVSVPVLGVDTGQG